MEILKFNVDQDRRNLVSNKQEFKVNFKNSPSWIQARQYENQMRQVQVQVVHGDNSPFDLTDVNPMLEGWMPDNTHRIIDNKHGVLLDPQNGIFRFDFPAPVFAVAGSYKQIFFRLWRHGKNIATLEFSMEVLADKVIDGLIPADYITPFEDIYDKLISICQNADTKFKDQIATWQQQVTKLLTSLNGDYASIQTTVTSLNAQLKALADKIEAKGLLTQNDFDPFKQEVEQARQPANGTAYQTLGKRLDNMPTKADLTLSTTYANLRRLGQKYRKQGSVASNAQGFTSLGDQVVVQYFQNYSPLDKQYGELVKFNVETGVELQSNQIKGFHGNSLAFNPNDGYLYLAPAEDTSAKKETAQRTTILRIDPDTLSIDKTIDLTGVTALLIHSVGYDSVNNLFVLTDNKTLEFYDQSWQLAFTLNWADIVGFEPLYMQGVQVNGDTLYWLGGRKSQIWVFKIDAEHKQLMFKTIYTLGNFQENLYPTGEIEGLGFNQKTDEIYLSSHVTVGSWGGLTQYFVTNTNFKIPFKGSDLVSYQLASPKATTFYAGKNDNYNPSGTKNDPFASLLEATTCMCSPDTKFKNLQLTTDMDETLVLADVSDSMFSPNGCQVKAAVIINCHNLYLTGLKTNGWSHYNLNALYVYNSQVRINGLDASTINADKVKYGVQIERSTVFADIHGKPKIYLGNSRLTTPGIVRNLTKGNQMAMIKGNYCLGSVTDIAQINKLAIPDFLYYQKMNAQIETKLNNKQVNFNLIANINSHTVDLSGLTQVANVTYLAVLHYVQNDPTNTTLQFYRLKDMTELKPSSFTLSATVTDN